MRSSIYQGAWNQLKSNPSVPLTIAAHPAHHRRIYKAIIKRKDEDTLYKFLLSEDGKVGKLSRVSEGHMIKITLTISNHIPLERMFS